MKDFLAYLFIPKESNNHRAKVLHHINLSLTIVFILLASFFIQSLKHTFPSVLGISANISTEELLLLTNAQRQQNGAAPLALNQKLTDAASKKAQDMFEYNYWAHNSPTGKTPWVFIKSSGYQYVYAGENLARGFSTAQDVVKAWMASPDHRANVLSSNYQDVGFAVKLGKLNGEDTVLVVEEFGNLNMIAKNTAIQDVVSVSDSVKTKPLISSSFLSFNFGVIIVLIFISVLSLDMIIIEKKKVMRFVGHNIDHLMYLSLILALIVLLSKGVLV